MDYQRQKLKKMNPATLINQTSGEVEYYTDPVILKAAKEVLGRIDLDPASSFLANCHVKARRYYGTSLDGTFTDGITHFWCGRIWMNHPFGRPETACVQPCERNKKNPNHVCHKIHYLGNAVWINKLIQEFICKNITEALCITYACTSEVWFQPLLNHPQCFLSPRTNYYTPDGKVKKGVTKGSVITYLGDNVQGFARVFQEFGKIKIAYDSNPHR